MDHPLHREEGDERTRLLLELAGWTFQHTVTGKLLGTHVACACMCVCVCVCVCVCLCGLNECLKEELQDIYTCTQCTYNAHVLCYTVSVVSCLMVYIHIHVHV